ncbi:MAG: hypothetical protein M3Y93_07360 [Pseudomonadota bacterium]|nr:hypothetical protein [Pseudomonadota bacterium]
MDRNQARMIIVGLAVLAVVLTLSSLFMTPMMGGGTAGPWMMGGYGPGWGMNGWGWTVMLLFWVFLIGGISMVAGWLFRQGRAGGSSLVVPTVTSRISGESALDLLTQRYVRGEITREQYDRIKSDIGAG